MFETGQTETRARQRGMSVLPPGADMSMTGRCAPKAALGQAQNSSFRFTPKNRLNSEIVAGPKSAANGSGTSHSITSSARSNTAGGISTPSLLAVFRLMTVLNCVGCSIGMSAGLAPFNILSTKTAARRNIAVKSTP